MTLTRLLALWGSLAATGATTAVAAPRAFYRPHVTVWTNRDDVYRRGERVRVFVETDQDAFLTVFRVDTDGRVRVLFPLDPYADNFVRGRRTYELEGWRRSYAFTVDDYPGMGYLFAVAAADPFDYTRIVRADHWDYRAIADGRIRGDPYVSLTELAAQLFPEGYPDWDYDIVPYYVDRRYDYPRFLCYDCHAYVGHPYWDPYRYSCVRFRIVVYNDPYYYPYRYYGGTRVVFVRPVKPAPRYVFKTWDGARSFVTQVRERPVNPRDRRPVVDHGYRGRDLGGVGAVPAPGQRSAPQAAPGRRSTDAVGTAPERAPVRRELLPRFEPRRDDLPSARVIPERPAPRTPTGSEPRQVEPRSASPERLELPRTGRERVPLRREDAAAPVREPFRVAPGQDGPRLGPERAERPQLERDRAGPERAPPRVGRAAPTRGEAKPAAPKLERRKPVKKEKDNE